MTVHLDLAQGLHLPLVGSHASALYHSHPVLALLAGLALLPLLATLALAAFLVSLSIYRMVTVNVTRTEPYAHLRRPKHADNFFPWYGDFGLIRRLPPTEPHLLWCRTLESSVFVYRGLFYSPRLFLGDPRAMGYILSASNSYAYPKPNASRLVLQSLLGKGVLVAEGDVHKRQRKILQPAFGVSAIRDLTPFFFKYSEKLAAKIGEMVDRSTQPIDEDKGRGANGVDRAYLHQSEPSRTASRPGAPVLDVSFWLNQATLDVIGDAGFGHIFNGLDAAYDPTAPEGASGDVINASFQRLMKAMSQIGFVRFMQLYLSEFPGLGWVRNLPTKRQRAIDGTYAALETVSKAIVEQKRREIQGEMADEIRQRGGDAASAGPTTVTKADFDERDEAATTVRQDGTTISAGKDLLHLMMRANMADDVSPREKLSDGELIGQITTLLLAGNETTSTQTGWALHILGDHPEVQAMLRAEIRDHFGARMERHAIGYDELMNMPYLDRFAKEMMRFASPVPSTVRTATRADTIPLSKPYPTRDGRSTFTSVPISAGQDLIIPIQAMNLSTEIWGPTATQFDPDRWLDDRLPESAKKSGLPMHLMTFIAGPRGCIGNRFAIAEFKALICSLIGRFHFENVEGWKVEKKQAITLRSRIEGQEDIGPQMPLRISRVEA
ncbi:uncharacterized protein PFL1_06060 [Pseudozyma flocculosa PF-1]|uniref:Related to Cytochrome P450 n=2 Tax=Pseudozyma flocculosa TaxID=84751 RepID=A0A5C3F3B8_9BASI|nr:uncharacterized protein PFL1_06060 [Pseudozyma flocculosa PF-1]EPQ26412.1 hypothetical protein PFL1_06060 [Pseudozyma flocculosa PF-1]SPO38994.1 related to Cytochrome P450 [Pseudozyma flocculosa]